MITRVFEETDLPRRISPLNLDIESLDRLIDSRAGNFAGSRKLKELLSDKKILATKFILITQKRQDVINKTHDTKAKDKRGEVKKVNPPFNHKKGFLTLIKLLKKKMKRKGKNEQN